MHYFLMVCHIWSKYNTFKIVEVKVTNSEKVQGILWYKYYSDLGCNHAAQLLKLRTLLFQTSLFFMDISHVSSTLGGQYLLN